MSGKREAEKVAEGRLMVKVCDMCGVTPVAVSGSRYLEKRTYCEHCYPLRFAEQSNERIAERWRRQVGG